MIDWVYTGYYLLQYGEWQILAKHVYISLNNLVKSLSHQKANQDTLT